MNSICPACGFELDFVAWDAPKRPEVYRQWRQRWIDGGMKWYSLRPQPKDWDPAAQLDRALKDSANRRSE